MQQIVLEGDAADFTTTQPANLQHASMARPTFRGVDIVVDPTTGMTNVGMRRLMLRGRREAGIDLLSPSDLKAIYEGQARKGQRLLRLCAGHTGRSDIREPARARG